MTKQQNSSWETSAKWYDEVVGEKGHYYHEHVILPNLLKLLDLNRIPDPKILDLGCGQGIVSRFIPKEVPYLGLDLSPSLIQAAQKRALSKSQEFLVKDLSLPFTLHGYSFTHALLILSLQNMKDPLQVLKNAAAHLLPKGKLFIILNHPCFRIPRQSHWGIDETKKLQYRRIDRYFTPLTIPITTHPGKEEETHTFTFHFPLSSYTAFLKESGFVLLEIQEWCSDKLSEGKYAKMENRSRQEFPLFLCIEAMKYTDTHFPSSSP